MEGGRAEDIALRQDMAKCLMHSCQKYNSFTFYGLFQTSLAFGFLVWCLLCYRTETIPHRQNRNLTKTAPQSFS